MTRRVAAPGRARPRLTAALSIALAFALAFAPHLGCSTYVSTTASSWQDEVMETRVAVVSGCLQVIECRRRKKSEEFGLLLAPRSAGICAKCTVVKGCPSHRRQGCDRACLEFERFQSAQHSNQPQRRFLQTMSDPNSGAYTTDTDVGGLGRTFPVCVNFRQQLLT